jgi:hypothetical protein
MSRRFPHGLIIFCTALYSFSIMNFGKIIIFTSLSYKNHLINYVANLILYNYGGSTLHVLSFKALTQWTCPGDFRMDSSFLHRGCFFYVNFGKRNIIFTSLPFKSHLINSNANSILYNFRGSFVHVLSFKALTQRTCPGNFRVGWSFFCTALILSLYKFRKNHHFHEPTVQKPI